MIVSLPWQSDWPTECQAGVVCLGNFDGVHRGHVALLHELRRQAQLVGGPAVAVTLEPHPLTLLKPGALPPPLSTLADRTAQLHQAGADHVLVIETTRSLLQLSARDFFEQVLCARFRVRGLVEGESFGFGRNREGNVRVLAELCREKGLPLQVLAPVQDLGGPISSSRVRQLLAQGQVHDAAILLGRPYQVQGVVTTGAQRGRTLGFPTANLQDIACFLPGEGVYAVEVAWAGQTWLGAANLGPAPTFGVTERKLEVHLLGFQGELLGETLLVRFHTQLRETRRFANLDELRAQLSKDVEQVTRLFLAKKETHS